MKIGQDRFDLFYHFLPPHCWNNTTQWRGTFYSNISTSLVETITNIHIHTDAVCFRAVLDLFNHLLNTPFFLNGIEIIYELEALHETRWWSNKLQNRNSPMYNISLIYHIHLPFHSGRDVMILIFLPSCLLFFFVTYFVAWEWYGKLWVEPCKTGKFYNVPLISFYWANIFVTVLGI